MDSTCKVLKTYIPNHRILRQEDLDLGVKGISTSVLFRVLRRMRLDLHSFKFWNSLEPEVYEIPIHLSRLYTVLQKEARIRATLLNSNSFNKKVRKKIRQFRAQRG